MAVVRGQQDRPLDRIARSAVRVALDGAELFLTEQRNVLAITKISPYAIENRTEASGSSSSKKDASSIKKEGTRSMTD